MSTVWSTSVLRILSVSEEVMRTTPSLLLLDIAVVMAAADDPEQVASRLLCAISRNSHLMISFFDARVVLRIARVAILSDGDGGKTDSPQSLGEMHLGDWWDLVEGG